MKTTNFMIAVFFTALVFASCEKDTIKVQDIHTKEIANSDSIKGRFDDTPFVWDIVYGSTHSNSDIFIGSYNISIKNSTISNTQKKVVGATTKNYSDADTFIINPVGIYVGAAFPAKALNNFSFDQDYTFPKNQVKLVYNYSDPFLDKVDDIDVFEYTKSFKKAINSTEFKKHTQAPSREQLEYYFTEFNTYSDIEKSFGSDVQLGKIFSAKVSKNSKKTRSSGRLMAKIISKNFTVIMATPKHNIGFFQAQADNSIGIDGRNGRNGRKSPDILPVYIKSITYGKVAFIAIESEYSYNEVKQALQNIITYNLIDTRIEMDKRTKEILSKSTISILAIYDNAKAQLSNDIETLNEIMLLNYSSASYGVPIYYQGRYVYNNSAFNP